MATENSGVAGGTTPTASSGVNRSTNASADSYIGSLISLTSKSEIRYEGVLYNINTDESSIGLKNVRSFGTEGRKKDGQQIPPSDKVYEYILFRGSDIKDLQVKSSPPAQPPLPPPPVPINNDPAIIQQSQYPRAGNTPPSLPSMGSVGSLNDIGSHSSQVGLPGSNFPGNLPLYPPGGLGTWGTSPQHPPNSGGSGMGMPMYWQGYYGPPNGLPHLHQQPLLRPPGLPMTSSFPPPMQYPNFNPSVPSAPSNIPIPLIPTTLPEVSLPMLPPSTLPFNLPPFSSSQLPLPTSFPPPSSTTSEPLPTHLPNKPLGLLPPPSSITTTLPLLAPFISPNDVASSVLTKPIPPATTVPFQAPALVSSGPLASDISNQPLATAGKSLQTGSSPNTSQAAHKDVEVVKVSSQTEPLAVNNNEPKPPILPLPTSRPNVKPNGGHYNSRYSGRGRDRGRGAGSSNDRAKFTEDFDFEAMNEKFNKDEVWGHLGKNRDGKDLDDDYLQEDYENEFTKMNSEPVYNKDDFFDNLSCTTLDNNPQNGRTKFSEQMKLDTETFGEFPRNWGGRGGRGPARGGRYHGGGYGRGGYGYGYGYNARGRGRGRGPPPRGL